MANFIIKHENPPKIWSPDNPSNIDEVGDQGVSEVMAWFVDARVLPITWFQGSVAGQSYLEMLEDSV